MFDSYLSQTAYLVGCQRIVGALVNDPLCDIAGYLAWALENNQRITAVVEPPIHADFSSGGAEFATNPELRLYHSAEGCPDSRFAWSGHPPKKLWPKDTLTNI